MACIVDLTLRQNSKENVDRNMKGFDKYSYLTKFIRWLYKTKDDSFLLYILYYDKLDPKNSEMVTIPYNFYLKGKNFLKDVYEAINKLVNLSDKGLA